MDLNAPVRATTFLECTPRYVVQLPNGDLRKVDAWSPDVSVQFSCPCLACGQLLLPVGEQAKAWTTVSDRDDFTKITFHPSFGVWTSTGERYHVHFWVQNGRIVPCP